MVPVLVLLRRAVSVAVAVVAIFLFGLRTGAQDPARTSVLPRDTVANVASTSTSTSSAGPGVPVGTAAATAAAAAIAAASPGRT